MTPCFTNHVIFIYLDIRVKATLLANSKVFLIRKRQEHATCFAEILARVALIYASSQCKVNT